MNVAEKLQNKILIFLSKCDKIWWRDLIAPEKAKHYEKVRELTAALEGRNGSLSCRELLAMKGVDASSGGAPEERTEEYYKRRPCPEYVRIAAEETAKLLGKYNCI